MNIVELYVSHIVTIKYFYHKHYNITCIKRTCVNTNIYNIGNPVCVVLEIDRIKVNNNRIKGK